MIAFDANVVGGCEIWMIEAKVLTALNQAQTPYRPRGKPARFDLKVPFRPEGKLTYVDVQPKADQTMDLPRSIAHIITTCVKCRGASRLSPRSSSRSARDRCNWVAASWPTAPERIEGISVRKLVREYTFFTALNSSGPTHNVADGTTIGYYRVVDEGPLGAIDRGRGRGRRVQLV